MQLGVVVGAQRTDTSAEQTGGEGAEARRKKVVVAAEGLEWRCSGLGQFD